MSLMSELEDLGELMATNITAKGVSASASDGLTTLAGKILQISGGGGSTTLFEDACNSASGLSNYGSSVLVRGSTATITMTYDSTENAYKLSGSGNYHAMIPIPTLDDEEGYIISMDCKGQAIRYNMVGFFLDNSADTTSYGLAFGLDIGKADNNSNQSLYSRLYRPNSDGTGYITFLDSNVLTADTWYKLTFTVDGDTLTGALYDGTTKLAEKTVTYTINNKQMGILLFCEKGTTQSACYVKNIKATTLGGGSDCTQYQTEINNAIEYINGSGS